MANKDDFWTRNGRTMTPTEAGDFISDLIVDLQSGDDAVREAAKHTLLTLKTDETVQQFITNLRSDNAEMRRWSALLLGQMGDRRAVLPLTERITDTDPAVRFEVYAALGWLADRRAIYPLMVAAVQEKEPTLRDVIEGVVAECKRSNM